MAQDCQCAALKSLGAPVGQFKKAINQIFEFLKGLVFSASLYKRKTSSRLSRLDGLSKIRGQSQDDVKYQSLYSNSPVLPTFGDLMDTGLNLVGDGALSEKQRQYLGKEFLNYHRNRSAYNGDFHNKCRVKPSFKKIRDLFITAKSKSMSPNRQKRS